MATEDTETVPLYGFDVGNTSVKVARRDGRSWEPIGRLPTCPAADLGHRLRKLFSGMKGEAAGARAAACSVQPEADGPLRRAWEEMGGGPIQFFGSDLPVPMPTDVPEPERVGTDRLLLALGARELAGAPCIVVSTGTAITVDLVNAEGAFAGGAIAPGFALAARALHAGAAFLPQVEITGEPTAPGRNTEEAIRLGVHASCVGGVLRLVQQYDRALGTGYCPILLTGGNAELLRAALPTDRTRHKPDLIFAGMAAALE
jgi:type III pantothenate kinase